MDRQLRLKTERLENSLCEQWARAHGWLSPAEQDAFVEALTRTVKRHVLDATTLRKIAESLPSVAEEVRRLQ